jgi:hypothetical protein
VLAKSYEKKTRKPRKPEKKIISISDIFIINKINQKQI